MNRKLSKQILSMTLAILVSACGGGSGGDVGNKISNASSMASYSFSPVVSNSVYSDILTKCIEPQDDTQPCRLSTLPYIGQTTSKPTKADILARTIISHEWMATRFSQLLDQMPEDMFLLFRGVTGIVIGADIRPSYYDPSTGAMYLDPRGLWITSTERSVISTVPDYRSEFGRELNFVNLTRLVKNNDYAWLELNNSSSRKINDILLPMSALLFHELAHANDFMPPALLMQTSNQNTPLQQADAFKRNFISTDLTTRAPLNSNVMFDLVKVIYGGEKASDRQKQTSAEQAGLAFQTDGANDIYNYFTQYEDAAMLFEEVMMKYHFNVDREIAFTDAPVTTNYNCSALIVRWGVRNRIGDELVKSRAKIIVQQLLGRNDASSYFTNIPTPRSMKIGKDWCDNIRDLSTPNTDQFEKMSNQTIRESDFKHAHERF